MKRNLVIAGAAVLLIAAGAVWLCMPDDGDQKSDVHGKRTGSGILVTGQETRKSSSVTVEAKSRPRKGPRVIAPKKGEKLSFGQWRDEFGEKDTEIRDLCRKIVDELQDALDANDRAKVLLIIAKFRAPMNEGGLDGYVSKELRGKAVEALGWFGSASLTDLFEFMADQDAEISEDAFSKFEQALDDWDMGDRERSKVLQEVAKLMTDAERIDGLLFNLNNMRNSVKADTVIGILENGSPEAQSLMKEQVEFYLDMDVQPTVEGVNEWKKANPDESTDEEFFGQQHTEG